jgi:hypothetical protein
MPGTPSIAIGTRTPCQWIVVLAGSALSSASANGSPWHARSSGPGTLASEAHAAVGACAPPTSHARRHGTQRARGAMTSTSESTGHQENTESA